MNLLLECQRIFADFFPTNEAKAWSCIAASKLPASLKVNECLLLIKPEVFYDTSNREAVFSTFGHIISHFDAQLVAIKVLSKQYVQDNSLIDKNYPTLNHVSRTGFKGIYPAAQKQLLATFQTEPEKILGGDQLLELHPHFTPIKLCEHCDSFGTKKIGSGIYACRYDSYILVNGFYPYQRSYLSSGVLLACVIRSTHSWKTLRHDFVGTIRPSDAAVGSLRRTFYDQSLGVTTVAKNGFHVSPGPIEAALQIEQFFSDIPFTSSATHIFKDMKITDEKIRSIFANPLLDSQPLFEITEDVDTSDALAYAMRS